VPDICPLSQGDLALLQLLSTGHTYQQAAKQLFIEHASVRQRSGRLCRKIGAENPVHAVAIAMAEGWIPGPCMGGSLAARVRGLAAQLLEVGQMLGGGSVETEVVA
jgi:DNA-binding CsgD family transcriptional regulator